MADLNKQMRKEIRDKILKLELQEDGYAGVDKLDREALDAWIRIDRAQKKKKRIHTSL